MVERLEVGMEAKDRAMKDFIRSSLLEKKLIKELARLLFSGDKRNGVDGVS